MAEERGNVCKVCGRPAQWFGCAPSMCADPPKVPADEHPLPWRWGVGPGEDPRERPNLLDANGAPLISRASGCIIASSYVRAVTERAGAMEKALAEVCGSLAAYLSEHDGDWEGSGYRDAMVLLNEIDDAAKAGG